MMITIVLIILLLVQLDNVDMQIQTSTLGISSCYIGSYQVPSEPFNACSGWRDCEEGFYCVSGQRIPCPAGTYGNVRKLTTASCSAPCPAGHYCPINTISGTTYPCGSANNYCSVGSAAPVPVPLGYYSTNADGSFLTNDNSVKTRSKIKICEQGFYCSDGIKYICEAGYYGNQEGLSTFSCSGLCPAGFLCPAGTIEPYNRPCSKSPNSYCPEGSGHPLLTAMGYYAVSTETIEGSYSNQIICPRGAYCIDGVKYLCKAGRYGGQVMETNSSCSGLCHAGTYCPPGSTYIREHGCGNSSVFCPEGSGAPTQASIGFYTVGNEYVNNTWHWQEIQTHAGFTPFENSQEMHRVNQKVCEPGFFCIDGVKIPCPAGRYGKTYGLSSKTCDAACDEGYYCPEQSTSPQEYPCNGTNLFCPFGSHVPKTVQTGYYTLDRTGQYLEDIDGHTTVQFHSSTRSWEKRCEPGHYCVNGVKYMCKRGYWGSEFGMIVETCSGLCSAGFYCPLGSISPTEVMCGDPGRYCPEGSWKPTIVDYGYYSIGGGNETTRIGQAIAPLGYYAENGILKKCRAGYYGAVKGLHQATCSGLCNIPGYYCPAGSFSPTMKACGSDNVICKPGSIAPIDVSLGFYTYDYTSFTLTNPGLSDYYFFSTIAKCKPGTYRNWSLSTDSNGIDNNSRAWTLANSLGYHGSDTVTAKMIPPCQLCPNGTYKATVGDSVSLCLKCNEKTTIFTADRVTCECTLVAKSGLIPHFDLSSGKCLAYTPEDFALLDEGAYGTNTSITRYNEFECEPGYYCVDGVRYSCPKGRYGTETRETRPLCAGPCAQGYYCPEASTSPYSQPCGAANRICPTGASIPTIVPMGKYSQEDIPENLRYVAYQCPPGMYCPGDGKRYFCSAGRYGDSYNISDPLCSGECSAGYYCNEGSTSQWQFKCGGSAYYCVTGSTAPRNVTSGFYGIHTGNAAGADDIWDLQNNTLSAEIPCEPGYFCHGGIKQPCPPGKFGWRYGMNTSDCGGQCAAGYYCPSYLDPAEIPEAPAHTQWPRKPHLQAAELQCGLGAEKTTLYYCPRGSFFPQTVGGGNYTIGGDATNTTRHDQAVCPPGTFCSDGLSLSCPKGVFGATFGLTTPSCTDWCTKGHYCGINTANPIPCPPYHYAGGATSYCSLCPGNRTTPLTCNDARSCCFVG